MRETANYSVAIAVIENRCVFNGLLEEYSPRTRGWTGNSRMRFHDSYVFPAYAGMDRLSFPYCPTILGIPRVRGDGPLLMASVIEMRMYSPRTRGWTPGYPGWFPSGLYPPHVSGDRLDHPSRQWFRERQGLPLAGRSSFLRILALPGVGLLL